MSGIYKSVEVCKNHAIANGVTEHFEIPVSAAPFVSVQIIWHDGTTAFTGEIYTTNRTDVAKTSTSAEEWTLEADATVTEVTAAAAGSQMIHLQANSRRLKIALTATAASRVSIYTHGKA